MYHGKKYTAQRCTTMRRACFVSGRKLRLRMAPPAPTPTVKHNRVDTENSMQHIPRMRLIRGVHHRGWVLSRYQSVALAVMGKMPGGRFRIRHVALKSTSTAFGRGASAPERRKRTYAAGEREQAPVTAVVRCR